MPIRSYEVADTAAIAMLFYDTVHPINSRDSRWGGQPVTHDD